MDNYSKLYWLTRLDYLHGIFLACAIIFGFWVGIYIFNYCFVVLDNANLVVLRNRITRIFVITLFIFSIIIACLIPTKNEMILIYAGGKTMNYVQSDTSLQKIPFQTTSIISEYLDKTLKEMKSENKKEKE